MQLYIIIVQNILGLYAITTTTKYTSQVKNATDSIQSNYKSLNDNI